MKKVFIGLLVGVCVITFSLPLMAADSPKGLDLSNLQTVSNSQLDQMRGQRWVTPTPGLFNQFKEYGSDAPYINGFNNAIYHLSDNIQKNNGNGPKSFLNSRAFAN